MDQAPKQNDGSEMARLLKRLYGNEDPTKNVLDFKVSWGDDAHKVSVEQRAKQINHALDQIEDGTATILTDEELEDL